jgi:hypothetical protein
MPVVWCLPEYSCGWEAQDQHGSSVPSTTYCVVSSSSSAVGTNGRSASSSSGVIAVIARLIVDWDTPNASPISA